MNTMNRQTLIKRLSVVMMLQMACQTVVGQLSDVDMNAPFGWCVSTSREEGGCYDLTGGEGGRTITLTSDGSDMQSQVASAIKDYDIIVFDGSAGDFIFSKSVSISDKTSKTIVGINGARLCTEFYVTDEIRQALDSVGTKQMSGSSGTGGVLSNGKTVDEECEYNTRQTIIDLTGDADESYRSSGIFTLKRCSNIIIRNLKFVGPGSVDVGGNDLITCTYTDHLWVDHCEFTDGMDGNFDITLQSDFVTVSWCKFNYTDRSYDHQYTCLISSSDQSPLDTLKLNVTFADCIWGEGITARTPMVRYGKIHLLNCYWTCGGCNYPLNPRVGSEIRIEGCYFGAGVKKILRGATTAIAWQWVDNYVTETYSCEDNGEVVMPYAYSVIDARDVPAMLMADNGAGATLSDPLSMNTALDSDVLSADVVVEMYDIQGHLVKTYRTDGDAAIDTDRLPRGVYIISIDDGRQKRVKKVSVE